MASTQNLERRIRTAQNISKTTKAMQMIAASKLRKAQDAALSSRPYIDKLVEITGNVTKFMEPSLLPVYMKPEKQGGKSLYIVISPDKGLCGGLITNLVRELVSVSKSSDDFVTLGKKVESPVARFSKNLVASFLFGNTLPQYDIVYPIAKIIDEQFLSGKVDSVHLISSHFVTLFSQKPEVTKLLPISPVVVENKEKSQNVKPVNKFELFEPDFESIFPDLLKRYMEMTLYQEILESYLSEQAARMLSMQNATNNARDIIEDLKLEYNKTRQAKITSEILDITSASIR